MFHRLELFVIRPRNGQQECGLLESLDLMFDRRAQRQHIARPQIPRVSFNSEAYRPLQDVDGDRAVCVMFLYCDRPFHRDQHNPKIRFLKESFSIMTRFPWFLLLRIRHLLPQVKLRKVL